MRHHGTSKFTFGMRVRASRINRLRASDLEEWGKTIMRYEDRIQTLEAEVEQLRSVEGTYRELLAAMARRDKNLDPVWMEQYARKELAALAKEQSE